MVHFGPGSSGPSGLDKLISGLGKMSPLYIVELIVLIFTIIMMSTEGSL